MTSLTVHVKGLNFVDIMAALGEVQTATLGCEVGGVVVEMGEDTKGFEIGDIGESYLYYPTHCY